MELAGPDSTSALATGASGQPVVAVHSDAEELALNAAVSIAGEVRRRVKTEGRFTLALAGGSTPRRTYERLAMSPLLESIPWKHVHVFWGDERCVDSGDPRSNERMAREALLDHVPIPPSQVHPMVCAGDVLHGYGVAARERGTAAVDSRSEHVARSSAAEYEELLSAFFPPPRSWGETTQCGSEAQERTALDLVLLGLGADGHTASLFPRSAALHEAERCVAAISGDARNWTHSNAIEEDVWRVTLTAPFINRAAVVVFIVSGLDKAAAVAEVLEGPPDPVRLPAQLIRPQNGMLYWFLDEGSAAHLSGALRGS